MTEEVLEPAGTRPVPVRPASARDVERSVVAFGVALLATAVVLSTYYSRLRPQLDWSNYAVGLLATAGLLGISIVAGLGILAPGRIDDSTDLVAWPGAFGAAGAGLMIAVALDDGSASAYVAGGVVVAISLAGIALTRRGPFIVSGIAGFFVFCTQLFSDSVGVDGDDSAYWPAALGFLAFAVVVTAAGWFFPTRSLSGVTSGAIAVAGFASLTGVLAVSGAFQAAFAGPDTGGFEDYSGDFPDYAGDTWAVLLMALALMVLWTACAVVTGQVGFRILVVAMAVSVTPLATVALQVEHPSWWGVALAAVGGATLVVALLRPLPSTGSRLHG